MEAQYEQGRKLIFFLCNGIHQFLPQNSSTYGCFFHNNSRGVVKIIFKLKYFLNYSTVENPLF